MARLESAEGALKRAERDETAAIEPSGSTSSAPNSQPETVATDSVDELTAAYGEKSAEASEASPVKQAPES
jgi:hypothetical protein